MVKRIVILALCFVALAVSMGSGELDFNPSAEVSRSHASRKDSLLFHLETLENEVKSKHTGKFSIKKVSAEYSACRKYLKQWEYIQDYLDPWYFKDEINGAPLPKLERETFGILVLEPKGMQVIDEILFENEPDINVAVKNIQQLKQSIQRAPAFKLNNGVIWMAARTALNRVYTISLTGFDTPGSLLGISDAMYILQALKEDMSFYLPMMNEIDPELARTLMDGFVKAEKYLSQHLEFESFDRFHFYKDYLAPLSANLLRMQERSGIEFPSEVDYKIRPVNERSEALFEKDFLQKSYFLKMPSDFQNQEVGSLGRILFYDPVLSKDADRACAGCHRPDKGFADGVSKSIARGRVGNLSRNSPTLLNSVYGERFFHDMRARTLEDQLEHVIFSPQEFAIDWLEILKRINSSAEYRNLFKKAFKLDDNQQVAIHHVQYALSSFVGELASIDSRFDRLIRGEIKIEKEDLAAIKGFNLFMGKAACGTCHFAPVFSGLVPPYYNDSESEVLGVPENPKAKKPVLDPDEGRAQGLLRENVYFNQYAFKTPTVRNIDKTGPYMHNGSYSTLEEVMDFYNKGGGAGIGISIDHQTLSPDPLKLSKKEIREIIAFMKSLNNEIKDDWKKPERLPVFEKNPEWNGREIGGVY